jgi:hypothetical protein
MSRVRTGVVGTTVVLAAAALLTAGCDSISKAKDSVDTATNSVEVCSKSSSLILEKMGKVEAAAKTASGGDLTGLKKTISTEFGDLHKGLEEQVNKAKDPEVKSALKAMDTEAAGWASNPDSFLKVDQNKLQEITTRIDKVCKAK